MYGEVSKVTTTDAAFIEGGSFASKERIDPPLALFFRVHFPIPEGEVGKAGKAGTEGKEGEQGKEGKAGGSDDAMRPIEECVEWTLHAAFNRAPRCPQNNRHLMRKDTHATKEYLEGKDPHWVCDGCNARGELFPGTGGAACDTDARYV